MMTVQSNVTMVSFNTIFIWLKRKESELSELLETLIISFSVYLFVKTTINNIFPAIFKMYKYVIQLVISYSVYTMSKFTKFLLTMFETTLYSGYIFYIRLTFCHSHLKLFYNFHANTKINFILAAACVN